MKCKDCIHYELCVNGTCDEHFTKDTPQNIREMFSPLGCETFKNKADFVEVVRCEKCAWATERTKDNELFKYQCCNTIACGKLRRSIDFCSYGERKNDFKE